MDPIQLVDCFEQLHQHLLRHEPDFQAKAQIAAPYLYRNENLSFFASHLIALVSGIDDQTAEGKRRIRRLLLDIGENQAAHSLGERLFVRERGGVLEKPLGAVQKEKLKKSLVQLRELEARREKNNPGKNALGIAFDIEMDQQENLPQRIQWLKKLCPCLSNLNAFRYLNRIGYPLLVPNSQGQMFFFRLGFLEKTGGNLAQQLDCCHEGEKISQTLKRSPLEIHLWINLFTGALPSQSPLVALCRQKPDCGHCPLTAYCAYFRFQRPPGQGGNVPLPVKAWRPTDRPRERLAELGAHRLEDAELLAIILRTGSGKMNVMDLARLLLDRFETLQKIEEASLEELQQLPGIGKMKAIELKAVFELGRRQTFQPLRPGDTILSSDDVFNAYRGRFANIKQEEFVLLMLNTKNQVIREEVISRGSLEASIVHPREVFKAALKSSASRVIFIHNHPSGNPEPSHDDHVITQRLEEAGQLLQIQVLDHVIVGLESYYSFTEGEIIETRDAYNHSPK